MQGNLCTKSNVIYAVRPKNLLQKRVKRERCSTPQRWSRRIRSLPPIPFNVLATHRKLNRNLSFSKKEKGVAKVIMKPSKKSPSKMTRETKNNIFINKNAGDKKDSVELVRIVPVMVYVKNATKNNLKSSMEEVKVQINGQLLTEAFNTYIKKDIKVEPPETRRSRRLRMLPPNTVNVNYGNRKKKRL